MYFQELTRDHIIRLRQHPFMQRCHDGSISRAELDMYLVQQSKYSSYFTRYLCALISNLPHNDDVMALASNLAEELGFDEEMGESHARIYAQMLDELGVRLQDAPKLQATDQLIATAFHYCRQRNPVYGLGALCLGAEAVVAAIYSNIIEGFNANGVNDDKLAFFHIHIGCDDGHAETMHRILSRMLVENPRDTALAVEAAEAMIDARLEFFTAIQRRTSAPCQPVGNNLAPPISVR